MVSHVDMCLERCDIPVHRPHAATQQALFAASQREHILDTSYGTYLEDGVPVVERTDQQSILDRECLMIASQMSICAEGSEVANLRDASLYHEAGTTSAIP